MILTKKHAAKFAKQLSLQGLGEKIREHISCIAVTERNVPLLDTVLDKEIPDVDVTRAATGGGAPIELKANGTHVVLFKITFLDGMPLSFHKHLYPKRIADVITSTHEFCLSGALRHNRLLVGCA